MPFDKAGCFGKTGIRIEIPLILFYQTHGWSNSSFVGHVVFLRHVILSDSGLSDLWFVSLMFLSDVWNVRLMVCQTHCLIDSQFGRLVFSQDQVL